MNAKLMALWIVNIKGGPNKEHFEIAVLRADNEHGRISYGWFGEDKLLVTHNGGPCNWPLTDLVWAKMVVAAHEIAALMNTNERTG